MGHCLKNNPCTNRTFCPKVVGHFVPRWWDILSQGGGTFCPKVTLSLQVQPLYARNAKTAPICILPKCICLNGGCSIAAPPHPPLGYAAVRRRKDLASLGLPGEPLSRGSPGPPPPVRPQRALAQGLMPSLRSGYQLLRAVALFGSDTSARRWCSLVPRCAPARRLCLRLVAMSSRLEFSCA